MNSPVTRRRNSAEAYAVRGDEVEAIVGRCVQCGMCNASCPTFVLENDERDGPRGRITMIGQMVAEGQSPAEGVRHHIGRCLACMACVTACPVGVDYARLISHARSYIRETTKPGLRDRVLNWFAAVIVPYPKRLRWIVKLAPAIARVGRVLRIVGLKDVAALGDAAPALGGGRATFAGPGTAATKRDRRGRVILLAGCAQQVLRPEINDATIRLLARSGIDVEVAAGAGCCGAAAEQAGDRERARTFARVNIDAWTKSMTRGPVDAIICNGAGCGVRVKDYPELLKDDPAYVARAAEISGKARDITEFIANHGLGPPRRWSSLKVAYQAPCQLRHGQGIISEPGDMIHEAGFTLVEMPEAGMCCGAGGAYSYREAETAHALRMRKADHILAVRPDVIATGSITCMKHIEPVISTPIVHIVELIDWAYGGPVPHGLEALEGESTDVPGPPPLDVDDYIRS